MEYPKISVVTVNLNLGSFLEETIQSVLGQGYPNLEYIIIDGGSTDDSVEIIKKYEEHIAWWVSEPDGGHFHAMQKGLERSTGEIMAWLNSDDLYHEKSLFAVAEIFTKFKEVDWITGFPTEFSEEGLPILRITLPWTRWSKYRYYTYDFQFIQQEGTFWRRSLWEKAGGKLNLEFKVAAEMDLWARFFRYAKLYTTTTMIGGFRYRFGNQISNDHRDLYIEECSRVIRRERGRLSVFQRLGLNLRRVLGFPFGLFFFYDLPPFQWVYEWMFALPPVIQFDFADGQYKFRSRGVKHPPLFLAGRQFSLANRSRRAKPGTG